MARDRSIRRASRRLDSPIPHRTVACHVDIALHDLAFHIDRRATIVHRQPSKRPFINASDRSSAVRDRAFFGKVRNAVVTQLTSTRFPDNDRRLVERPSQQPPVAFEHKIPVRRTRVTCGKLVVKNNKSWHVKWRLGGL